MELKELEKALAAATTESDRLGALLKLASELMFTDAVDGWERAAQALELAEKLGMNEQQAEARYYLASCLWRLGEFSESVQQFECSVDGFLGAGNLRMLARAYCGLGIVCGILEMHAEAIEYFEQALVTSKKAGWEYFSAVVTGNIGHVYLHQKNYDEALNCFQAAYDFLYDQGRLQVAANILSGLAGVYVESGQLDKGLTYAEKTLRLCQEADDPQGVAVSIMNIGLTYQKMGDLKKAESHLLSALEQLRSLNHKVLEQDALKNLSQLYDEMKDHERSVQYLTWYMELHKEDEAARVKERTVQQKRWQRMLQDRNGL